MKINFKNNPKHRTFHDKVIREINFSKEPKIMFEEIITDNINNPIPIWSIPLMIDDDSVVFGLFDGRLIKYNIKTKIVSEIIKFEDRIYSSPLLVQKHNLIIAASDSGEISAIDVNTLEKQWHKRFDAAIHSSPSFCEKNNLVYVGCYDNTIYALDVKSGEVRRRKELEQGIPEDPYSSPTIGNEQVFIGTGNKLISLTANLDKIWEKDLGSIVDATPAIDLNLGIGIIGTEAGRIILFSTQEGEILKEWNTGSQITCSPVISQHGIACIGNDQGNVYGINLQNQEIIWVQNYQSPFRYTSLTCTPDHKFIFVLSNGFIVCVKEEDGESLWRIFGDQGYHTPPLVTPNGYLFCGSHFGYIGGYKIS